MSIDNRLAAAIEIARIEFNQHGLGPASNAPRINQLMKSDYHFTQAVREVLDRDWDPRAEPTYDWVVAEPMQIGYAINERSAEPKPYDFNVYGVANDCGGDGAW